MASRARPVPRRPRLASTALAALRGERRRPPPRLGTFHRRAGNGHETTIPAVAERFGAKVFDHFVDAPVAVGCSPVRRWGWPSHPKLRTTVKGSERARRSAPPTLAAVEASAQPIRSLPLVITKPPAMPVGAAGLAGKNVAPR